MTDDGSEVTGAAAPNPNPQPADNVTLPQQTFLDLTQAINAMREELVLQRTMNNNENPSPNPNPNPQPAPANSINIRNSSLNYYPDIDELCRHLYLDNPEQMQSKSAMEWLKSLYTLASILRCSWILDDPPLRPTDVNDGKVIQITIATMANFRRKIPPELKFSLPINVDDDATTPSMAYNRLVEHFYSPDPFLHDKFRSQLEARSLGKNKKVAKYMK